LQEELKEWLWTNTAYLGFREYFHNHKEEELIFKGNSYSTKENIDIEEKYDDLRIERC
jgi:hypothetical protein